MHATIIVTTVNLSQFFHAGISKLEAYMLHSEQTKFVKARILKAENKLKACFQCADYDHEREKILADAVRAAREEFFDRMATLFPESKA